MMTSITISIIGAISAILISFISAWRSNKYNIILQTRKLKEEHYFEYIEALHNLAAANSKETTSKYVAARSKLFIIASENIVKKMLKYEEDAVGKQSNIHDELLTELIKEIRIDLKLKDKKFPTIYLKKA